MPKFRIGMILTKRTKPGTLSQARRWLKKTLIRARRRWAVLCKFIMTGMTAKNPIKLINIFKYWKQLGHQSAAIEMLEQEINQLDSSILDRHTDWYGVWIAAPEEKPTPFDNTWDGIFNCAREAGAVWPECVAAQWALESAWGQHTSGKNNYFGIKGKGTIVNTWEDYGAGPVNVKDEFQDYATPFDCIKELVDKWYKDYRTYKGVNRASSIGECAFLLKKEGYATDPQYASKLLTIIKGQTAE